MIETELLADELKMLVGWGGSPERVPRLPQLRQFCGVTDDMPLRYGWYVIKHRLVEATASLEPRKCRACRLLLTLEGNGLSAPNRRGRAIMILGAGCSIDAWRRPDGPERQLMFELARVLCGGEQLAA